MASPMQALTPTPLSYSWPLLNPLRRLAEGLLNSLIILDISIFLTLLMFANLRHRHSIHS